MSLTVKLVKAFTRNQAEGNPAGVVLDANSLTDEQMLEISAQLGFSESAFVQKSDQADFKVRFFTPTQEVDLCGHATIATFHALVEANVIDVDGKDSVTIIQESKAGLLSVTVYKDGLIVMTQPQPEFFQIIDDNDKVASLLALKSEDLDLAYPTQAVSTGSPKLMIPIKSREQLFAIQPQLKEIAEYCKQHGVKGFYPFTTDPIDHDSDFHARQFNPLAGINEDPITGVAGGALGAYAVHHHLSNKNTFVIEQGYIMNKPGKIYVEIDNEVRVGGYAVTFGTSNI
ncbi:MAG TPA: PhzF family phenazine biosynthesis isomerase [Vitreimonas sp.]|nr:PhzF family phenazine biosynthesis isomerase [Vitreimonas sp.]